MRASTEISIDLTAQELVALPALDAMVEVDDIGSIEPLPLAQPAQASNSTVAPATADDELIEIELTAAQIDELLSQVEADSRA